MKLPSDAPQNGCRVRFDLETPQGERALYRVRVMTDDETYEASVEIGPARALDFGAFAPPAPAWVEASARPFAKQIASRGGREGASWPRRVLRWRDAGGD